MIEIPRDKIGAIGKDVNALVSSNNQSGDSWVKIARDILEGLPQAKKVLEQIQGTVAQAQAEKPHKMTPPTYEAPPKKNLEGKIKIVNFHDRAEQIFDKLIEEADKNKLVLATMKGSTLLEMLKGKREMVVGKIAEEISR